MKTISFLILNIILLFSQSLSAGILFKDLTIAKAVELAAKEGKLVFVDFYADACPPCKYMENNVFNDSKFGSLINENFIAIRSHSGNIEGKKEQAKYRIDILPTILIIDPIKGELTRFRGKKELSFMTAAIENALKGNFEQGDKPLPKEEVPPHRPTGLKEDL